ncbi:MAG: glycosyltransferase family 39 protein [Phycisphaeraceae bacterium]
MHPRHPRHPRQSRIHWCDWLLLLTVFVTSSGWCLTASQQVGLTFDEANYIANGLERRRTGSYYQLMRQGTMPLPIDVTSLTVYAMELGRDKPFRIGTDGRSQPVVGEDIPQVMHTARGGTLLFWGVLLLYGFLTAHQIAGPWAGRLALVMLAVEPNFLGHAVLATTDIAVTACTLAFAFHYARGRDQRALHRVWIPGLWYGFALLSKASALVFGPLCMIAIELHRWTARRDDTSLALQPVPIQRSLTLMERWKATRDFRRDFFSVIGIGVLLMFAYVGTDFSPEPSFLKWAQGLEEGSGRSIMLFIAESLRIFPNAANALAYQIKHNMKGHGSYLLGEVFPKAKWYYFPIAMTMKLTVPMMVMLLMVALVRLRSLWNWAMLAALALIAFSVTYRVQIGIRMVFPGMAMLIVGLACAVVFAIRSFQLPGSRTAMAAAIGGLLTWSVVIACCAWPDGVSYINELWGGQRNGYKLLSDSNYDWGQGLPQLDEWRREQKLEQIDLWCFSTDPAQFSPQYHRLMLHVEPVANLGELAGRMKTQYLAVGTTLLYGAYADGTWAHVPALLRGITPVAQTSTFMVFRIAEEEPSPAIPCE